MLVAIDPGLHHCGVALFTPEGTLTHAELVKNPVDMPGCLNAWPMAAAVASRVGGFVTEVVVEIPQVYPGRQKGDPNDLIDLAAVVGGCVAVLGGRSYAYRPAQWKGQTPKDVTTARAKAKLSATEQGAIEQCQPHLMHNVWDAVALGLAHLKKTGRRQ